jgi:hypothetical protein
MGKPYKIIWKYKNDNRYYQYNQFIFVGNAQKKLYPLMNKIKDLTLFETWMQLSLAEIDKFIRAYGEDWYRCFFNMYHTAYTVSQVMSNTSMKKDIKKKFGDDWYEAHITSTAWSNKKLVYNYASSIKMEYEFKKDKSRLISIIDDDDEDDDTSFRLKSNDSIRKHLDAKISRTVPDIDDGDDDVDVDNNVNNMDGGAISVVSDPNQVTNKGYYNWKNDTYHTLDNKSIYGIQSGGANEEDDFNMDDLSDLYASFDDDNVVGKMTGEMIDDIAEDIEKNAEDQDNEVASLSNKHEKRTEDDIADLFDLEEQMDMEEIEKMYIHEDVKEDKNVDKTRKMIEKALGDDKAVDKVGRSMADISQDKDANVYAEKLKDVYEKTYIKSQFIYPDDTVTTIKNKICVAIKNNKKFGKIRYILPSRQYLWSQYVYKNKIESVMIGQKWMRRNELLDVDVEPDNRFYMYEQVRGKLGMLRHNLKRYGNKIRREDDNNNIMTDYQEYITNNDIYLLDIYNELGVGYSPDQETLKNIQDIYRQLYFPNINTEELKNIVKYLNKTSTLEDDRMSSVYETLVNDMILENEIMNMVEDIRKKEDISGIFIDENHITQSTIHVNVKRKSGKNTLDLYRLFNNFVCNETYPYIQYQTVERGVVYKYSEHELLKYASDDTLENTIMKWFETSPFGLIFKVKIGTIEDKAKFMSIELKENGRIEYKTQWQESDNATLADVKKTHQYINDIIDKLMSENENLDLITPKDYEYNFAFINTIQKYTIPGKGLVDHNDLSDFARYFYPYVTLVIEPRKRQAKNPTGKQTSKYGTYLKYKRVSKYDNKNRMEQRIIYFLRNYEYDEKKLSVELAKQFNITDESALENILQVRAKYPDLKKSRKILKKLENLPKYKSPGISIHLQGKTKDKYKIRISGARDKAQLDSILEFMNILLYLYVQTYILKKKEMKHIKDTLKKLTNIAKRRALVDVTVNHVKVVKDVKRMAQADKFRIGFKPEKGQSNWSRLCQNSGTDKKRRHQDYNSRNLNKLIEKGFTYNKELDVYEKKYWKKKDKNGNYVPKKKGDKEMEDDIIIRTVKVPEHDDNGNELGTYMHYSCNPEDNGEHMYIGFLSKSANPHGHCMPCCFKKNPALSKNKEKRKHFNDCIGNVIQKKEESAPIRKRKKTKTAEKLYVLQDTNKIPKGRIGFLPKSIDRFINNALGKNKTIKHHYLEKTKEGYFFKYGTGQVGPNHYFMDSITNCVDLTLDEAKAKLIEAITNDTNNQIFISLNDGDIKTSFETREKFIEYIRDSPYLTYDMIKDLVTIPGVFTEHGINLIIFNKRVTRIKRSLERESVVENFYLECNDPESRFNIKDEKRDNIVLIHDDIYYHPVVQVNIEKKNAQPVFTKMYKWKESSDNIINHISDFYIKTCLSAVSNNLDNSQAVEAKRLVNLLHDVDSSYTAKYQVVDVRNKCKYIITKSGLLLPVKPSGCPWNVKIINNMDKYIDGFKKTYDELNKLYTKSKKSIAVKPIGVYYESKRLDKYKINSIVTMTKSVVPIQPITVSAKELKKLKLTYEKKPLVDKIDEAILDGYDIKNIDRRLNMVARNRFEEESYQLFRLELSNYLAQKDNAQLREKIINVLNSKKYDNETKNDKIRLMLYKVVDKNLHDKYESIAKKNAERKAKRSKRSRVVRDYEESIDDDPELVMLGGSITQYGGKIKKLVHKIAKYDIDPNYKVSNDREVCSLHGTKDECDDSNHCKWANGECYMKLTARSIVKFINKVSEELVRYSLEAREILQIDEYFVSDIVDKNLFRHIPGQKVLKSTSANIKRIMHDIFGSNIPVIGKRRNKGTDMNEDNINTMYPLIEMNKMYTQRIIENNLSVIRAYANGYYWQMNDYYVTTTRNIGYYSKMQSDLTNRFKSTIIEWLTDSSNSINDELLDKIRAGILDHSKDPVTDYITRLVKYPEMVTDGEAELIILSTIYDIPIVVYDETFRPIHLFKKGKHTRNPKIGSLNLKKTIGIRYTLTGSSTRPESIDAVYHK